jgi:putative ABC transport system permease protein
MLALKTLISDRRKLLTALLGVAFSVVLVNLQGGLFLGLIRKASLLVDHGGADIWVGHKRMHNVDFAKDIPTSWIYRLRTIEGVQAAEPFLIGHSVMTLPNGGFEPVFIIGRKKHSSLGSPQNLSNENVDALRSNEGVTVDVYDADKLLSPQLGEIREIGGRRVRIVARTRGILGFLVTPYIFTTLERASTLLNKDQDFSSYFLVKLAEGANPQTVLEEIRARLPEADAYTAGEYARMSVSYWMRRTGLGISFGAATVLGLLVGVLIVAQTLYTSVLDRLAEFGALKAIGAADQKIFLLLVAQAVAMAVVGSVLGLCVVYLIQSLWSTPRASILVPWPLSLGSCVVVFGVCVISSLFPYLRIRQMDAAMVLQM